MTSLSSTGLRARAGKRAKVLYSEGCKITIGGSWTQDEVTPSDPEEDRKQIAEAVKVARRADVIVLAIGGNEQTSREAWSPKHLGDRPSLDLVGRQEELVKAMLATGKPVVVLLFNGRPLSINYVSRNVPAILECWYLGQESGHAVAEVLFGDFNPGGKLPISIPRSAGHLPAFYNHKPSARRGYLFDEVSPLYAFGYGLSYTRFAIENVRLAKSKIRRDGRTQVQADVTNTGQRAGTETVQMYIRDRVSSVTRPVKELKAFRKILLEAGRNAERRVRNHAGPARVLRHRYELSRGAGRIRNHGGQFLARQRSSKGHPHGGVKRPNARSTAEAVIPGKGGLQPGRRSRQLRLYDDDPVSAQFLHRYAGDQRRRGRHAPVARPSMGRVLRSHDGCHGRPHQHALGKIPSVGALDVGAVGRRHDPRLHESRPGDDRQSDMGLPDQRPVDDALLRQQHAVLRS